MNELEKAEAICKRKFNKGWFDVGEFEQRQVIKIIAGTVVWRTEDCFINKENRMVFITTCSECKCTTEVPFEPDGKRPIFCGRCYNNRTMVEDFNKLHSGV